MLETLPLPDETATTLPWPRGRQVHGVFCDKRGRWLLSVTDNGSGMPIGKNLGKNLGRPGLGTGIVEAQSKQLDATVTVLDANPGTRVEVRHTPALKEQSSGSKAVRNWLVSAETSTWAHTLASN